MLISNLYDNSNNSSTLQFINHFVHNINSPKIVDMIVENDEITWWCVCGRAKMKDNLKSYLEHPTFSKKYICRGRDSNLEHPTFLRLLLLTIMYEIICKGSLYKNTYETINSLFQRSIFCLHYLFMIRLI